MNSLPTRRRLSAAVLVLATAAIFATGCGDSTDSTDTTSTAPSASSSPQMRREQWRGGRRRARRLPHDPHRRSTWTTWTGSRSQPTILKRGPPTTKACSWSDIFSYVGVQPDAATLILTASDGTSVEIPLDDISSDDALLARRTRATS